MKLIVWLACESTFFAFFKKALGKVKIMLDSEVFKAPSMSLVHKFYLALTEFSLKCVFLDDFTLVCKVTSFGSKFIYFSTSVFE